MDPDGREKVGTVIYNALVEYSICSISQAARFRDRIHSGQLDTWGTGLVQILLGDGGETQSQERLQYLYWAIHIAIERERRTESARRSGRPRIASSEPARLPYDTCQPLPSEVRDKIYFLTAVEPYCPCTKSLYDLDSVHLAQLTEETHHRGKVLIVRRVGWSQVGRTSILTTVQDGSGDTEHLEIYNGDWTLGQGSVPRTAFAIKEPYLTLSQDQTLCLRVDHPTDILPIDPTDPLVPEFFKRDNLHEEAQMRNHNEGTACKDTAPNHVSLQEQTVDLALKAYEDAIVVLANEGVRRCSVPGGADQFHAPFIACARWIHDTMFARPALQVLDRDDLDMDEYHGMRVNILAASTAYFLRDFAAAQRLFEKHLDQNENDSFAERLLERNVERLREEYYGDYDFAEIVRSLTDEHCRVDAADFTRSTRMGTTVDRGRGLFALDDFEAGDLVMCEKALCASFCDDLTWFQGATYDIRDHGDSIRSGSPSLWQSAIRSCLSDSGLASTIIDLQGKHTGMGSDVVFSEDGRRILDTFQLRDIIAQNSFAVSLPSQMQKDSFLGTANASNLDNPQMCSALYRRASLINHSCLPNVNAAFLGDLIVIRAVRRIE